MPAELIVELLLETVGQVVVEAVGDGTTIAVEKATGRRPWERAERCFAMADILVLAAVWDERVTARRRP